MLTALLYAVGASVPLAAGAVVGVRWQPPQRLVAAVLAYAAGAQIVSTSFELFEPAYEGGGGWRAGTAFIAGALVFVVATPGSTGAPLAVPPVWLYSPPCSSATSPRPSPGRAACSTPDAAPSSSWLSGAAPRRSSPPRVIGGRYLFAGVDPQGLAYPLAFAAGAVLASVIDTLAPEAFNEGGPAIALASAAGFLTGFLLSV